MTETVKPAVVDPTGRHSLSPKNAPITLPARSFDIGELQKSLSPATRAKLERRDKVIGAGIRDVLVGTSIDEQDRRNMPDHKFVNVENTELGITERTQVFDPEAVAEREAAEADAQAEAEAVEDVVDDGDFEEEIETVVNDAVNGNGEK